MITSGAMETASFEDHQLQQTVGGVEVASGYAQPLDIRQQAAEQNSAMNTPCQINSGKSQLTTVILLQFGRRVCVPLLQEPFIR